MAELAQLFERSAKRNDEKAFMRVDREFNELCVAAAKNEFAAGAMRLMASLSRRFWYQHYKQAADMPETAKLHADIARAIAKADEEGAAKATDRLMDMIQSFTRAIALEYSKQNLRAVSVCPGSISSGMTDASGTSKENVGPGFPEHDVDWNLLSKLLPAIGQGFAGPEAVASVVAMLASEDGKFITGTEIRIDGGTHM